MALVHAFNAVRYSQGPDVSAVVAPPYDVLDASGKARLLDKSPQNIVAADLPHIPAKELGPPEAYARSAATLANWLSTGVLRREPAPVMAVYRQSFHHEGTLHRRTGMFCTLEAVPFGPRQGGGVLPHEQTFSGPKEDRLALMRATATQLSPIFGLHQDEHGHATRLLASICAAQRPDVVALTDDGTQHELRLVGGVGPGAQRYAEALRGEDVFIADGHHRYTTALNYLAGLGAVPADHPARRCMFVLVPMSDPGLVIGPTHRVLGGMSGYSWPAFEAACAGKLAMAPVPGGLEALHAALLAAPAGHLGVWDFATSRGAVARPVGADPLAGRFGDKPRQWRELDVAIVQHLIVEGVCEPALNGGSPVKWAFPHSVAEVADIGAGRELGSGGGKGFVPQLAVLVRPTPLESVRAVSRANVLMPQKSTFFLPKLATGLLLHELR